MSTTSTLTLKKKKAIQCYIILAVPIIGYLIFSIYPMIWAAVKSLYYYTGIKSETRYIGLSNFLTAFSDKAYWNSWYVTFKFGIYKLPFEIPLAICLALLLNKKIRFTNFYRTVYYLPSVISVAIVGVVFTGMFDYFGVINKALLELQIIKEPIAWFSDSRSAFFALIVGNTWTSFGINVMYFLAAFQNVPKDVYEAAYLDGAGRFTTFFKITLPLIGNVAQVIILLAINGSLQVCDYILATTNGAPGGTTFTVQAYMAKIYLPGFASQSVNIGYGCALAIITAVVSGIVAIIYMKLSNRLSDNQ